MDVRIKKDNILFKYRVSGIIINDGKILLEKYGEDSYCLPGGYVNLGETSSDAINRELSEEIGFEFKIDTFLGTIENFFTNIKNEYTHGIDFYYKVSFKNKNDIDKIDFDRVEDDHGFIIKHHMKWVELDKLKEIKLLPELIKDEILKENNEIFHHILKQN